MVRTLISLDEDAMAWLDEKAAREGRTRAALVRRAVALLRAQSTPASRSVSPLLEKTHGIWRRGDGLVWQRKLRNEW